MAIARVAGQNSGNRASSTSVTVAMPGNVTSGNVVIVVSVSYRNGAAPGNHAVTKTAGTGTIGTVINDRRYSFNSGAAYIVLEINRVPITGSGSLTLQVASASADSVAMGLNEYSGLNTLDGASVTNTGSGTTESTGNITGHAGGLMVGGATELESGTIAHTSLSDVLVYEN